MEQNSEPQQTLPAQEFNKAKADKIAMVMKAIKLMAILKKKKEDAVPSLIRD